MLITEQINQIAERPVEPSSLTASLPRLLTWQTSEAQTLDAAAAVESRYFWKALRWHEDQTNSGLWNLVARLPDASRKRLISAPAFAYLLYNRHAVHSTRALLNQFAKSEYQLRDSNAATLAEPAWTALGDFYWDSPARQSPSFVAPKVETVVLDARSPYRGHILPKEAGQVMDLTDEELRIMTDRIRTCLLMIRSISPLAAATVCSAVQVIALGKTQSEQPSSTSIPGKIGMIALTNYHLGTRSTAKMCDALIHEVIHSVIFRTELDDCLVSDRIAAAQTTVTSPWTGRLLPLHAFLHACFVWYGLWNFWNLHPADEEAQALQTRASVGFHREPLRSYLHQNARERVSASCLKALDDMQRRVAQGSNQPSVEFRAKFG